MPEGPSIILLKEEVKQFEGKEIVAVSGNSKIDQSRLPGKKIIEFKSWGKHFLICLDDLILRIHFLMFGTYRINERKDKPERLNLIFENGEINLYSCSVRILEGDVNKHYDWSIDVMNDSWNAEKAKKKLKSAGDQLICDALLNQDIFAGVGNIIKNEVLYRLHIHPESLVKKIPGTLLNKLVKEARTYSFEFLEWKRNHELRKHWLAHNRKICLRCNLPFTRKHTGLKKRRSFFCTNCQKLYV